MRRSRHAGTQLAIAVLLGSLALGVVAPPAAAATALQWRATLDGRDPPSTLVIRRLAAGPAYLHGQVAGLTAGVTYGVVIRRGTCAKPGTKVATLPSVKARADGQAVWTSALTAGQRTALIDATASGRRAHARIGSARCGNLTRSALPASPAHRIGVRTVAGTGELYDRVTGTRWTARGNNYIQLAPQTEIGGGPVVSHSTFNTDRYDPVAAERALRAMHADGYTAVRVFLGTCCTGGLADPTTNHLSAGYLDNLVDFLERARRNGLQVMPTLDWLPAIPRYDTLIGTTCGTDFGVANCHFMAGGGLAANELFFRDLVGALKARGARLDAVWAWQVRNELSFDSDQPPLALSSGTVTAANGLTYDMAVPADKKRIQDESLAWYLDRTRSTIRSVDPGALVTVGFFVPQEPNPARPGDPRVIDPRPAYASTLDFIDVHVYPFLDLTLAQLAENYGLEEVPETKPLVFGELGAFRFTHPTSLAAVDALAGTQVRSCDLGVDGWLTWTWSLPDPDIWNATEAGAAIRSALAPKVRPDACDWGPVVRDLAYNADASASSTLGGDLPSHAVDADNFTKWNSGGDAPRWIQVDFGAGVESAEITFFNSFTNNTQKGFLNDGFSIDDVSVAPVPLPAPAFMLIAGLAGLAAIRRKRAAA